MKGKEKNTMLIFDFNKLKYDHSLHQKRKHFCRYCIYGFTTEEISKDHIKDCFKVIGKQTKITKKSKYVNFENFRRKYNRHS